MHIPEKAIDFKKIWFEENEAIGRALSNPAVMEYVAACNINYISWDELKYKKFPFELKPEVLWAIIKFTRKQKFQKFEFGDWKFEYLMLDKFQRQLHRLDKEASGGLELQSSAKPEKEYIISSLMEEAIASSQLEGAVTTRKIAKEMLRKNQKPKTNSEKMILNGYKTIQKILELKSSPLTVQTLLEIHKQMTEDTLEDKNFEGAFRNNNEVVVGDPIDASKVYYQPTIDYSKIPQTMQKLCDFANSNDKEFIHPIIKAIILHFLIGYIHPFEDGNGRTARSIFYWHCLSKKYSLFEFMAISKSILQNKTQYGQAYLNTEKDENDLTYFIKYNLDMIENALDKMEEYITRKQKEQAESLHLLTSIKNINARQAEILKQFYKQPEKQFEVKEIKATYGIAYDTARTDLQHLTAIGRVSQIKVQKKYLYQLNKNAKNQTNA